MRVAFRRLAQGAQAPLRAHAGDAGYDLVAAEGVVLGPGERAVVGTGIAVAVPDGYAGLVLPRSGLAARHGIPLINHDRAETFRVERGMRIAQLVLVRAADATFFEGDLPPGADGRGEGGFGSSGS